MTGSSRIGIDRLAMSARLDVTGAADEEAVVDDTVIAPAAWSRLSPREREVLALVSHGRTNREIADALFISEKTASVHVSHILDKLGVSSRVEAALMAARGELYDPSTAVPGSGSPP